MNAAPPPVARFLWIGPSLSVMERLSLCSFLNHGYDVRLYTYGPVSGVPKGVRIESAAEVLSPDEIFTYEDGFGKGSFAGFSDLFRYELIYRFGGWWFDLDFVSIRPRPEPADLLIATSYEGKWGECANACALYAPPGHPILNRLRQAARQKLAGGPIKFGDIGPFLVQKIVRDENLFKNLAPWWEFSPYPWRQIHRVALPGLSAVVKDQLRLARFLFWQLGRSDFRAGYLRGGTRAIHLHNEVWRAQGLDKNARYQRWSLYERLKRRHLLAST